MLRNLLKDTSMIKVKYLTQRKGKEEKIIERLMINRSMMDRLKMEVLIIVKKRFTNSKTQKFCAIMDILTRFCNH